MATIRNRRAYASPALSPVRANQTVNGQQDPFAFSPLPPGFLADSLYSNIDQAPYFTRNAYGDSRAVSKVSNVHESLFWKGLTFSTAYNRVPTIDLPL